METSPAQSEQKSFENSEQCYNKMYSRDLTFVLFELVSSLRFKVKVYVEQPEMVLK